MAEAQNIVGVIVIVFLGIVYLLGLCLFLRNKRNTTSRQYRHLIDEDERDSQLGNYDQLQTGLLTRSPEKVRKTTEQTPQKREKSIGNKNEIDDNSMLDNERTDRSDIMLLSKNKQLNETLISDRKLTSPMKDEKSQLKSTENADSSKGKPDNKNGQLIQVKKVDTKQTTSKARKFCCIELRLDFQRFHLFGSMINWCKEKDSTLFFVQLLVTTAFYLFLLFVLANLVNYQNLVWTETWTVAVSIIVSLMITLILMITVNHYLLSYQRKKQAASDKNRGKGDETIIQEQKEKPEDLDLEALNFAQKSHKCGIFDFLCILMIIFFFLVGIVAAYYIWFLTASEAGWILMSFVITIAVDLLVLRPIAIIMVAIVRSTYNKSVDPTGVGYQAGLLDGAEKAGIGKSINRLRIKTNEDGTKFLEGDVETVAVTNNNPKTRKTLAPGSLEGRSKTSSFVFCHLDNFILTLDDLFENEAELLSNTRIQKDAASLELTQAGIVLNENGEILTVTPDEQKISGFKNLRIETDESRQKENAKAHDSRDTKEKVTKGKKSEAHEKSITQQRKGIGNARSFKQNPGSIESSTTRLAKGTDEKGEAERLISLMENNSENDDDADDDEDDPEYALFKEDIFNTKQRNNKRRSTIDRLSIKSNRVLLAKINGMNKESKDFYLQPGEYGVVNEKGELVRVDEMKEGGTTESNLQQLSEAIKAKNLREKSNLVVVYHDELNNKLYHINEDGEVTSTRAVLTENSQDERQETIYKLHKNHEEFLINVERQREVEEIRQEQRILKEGDFFVLNEKGEILDYGELNKISTKGKNAAELAKALKMQNNKEKTRNEIVYHDPTDGELYLISSDGKIENTRKRAEEANSTKGTTKKDELTTLVDKIVINHYNHEAYSEKGLSDSEENAIVTGIQEEGGQILQKGEFVLLTEDGKIQQLGTLQTGKQFGQNPGKIASLVRAKNQQEGQKLNALYIDPKDEEMYYIDAKGKVYNSEQIKQGEIKNLEKSELIQKIIESHERRKARSNSDASRYQGAKLEPFIKQGQYAVFDEKGNLQNLIEVDKRESAVTQLNQITESLKAAGQEDGLKHFVLFHDPRTGALVRVDESGKVQNVRDIPEAQLPKENKQFIKDIIQKHTVLEGISESKRTNRRGPTLQPGEFAIVSEEGMVKDIGEMNLGEQFKGQNTARLAETIKSRNVKEGANLIAFYHDPDTHELTLINKDGSLVMERALLRGDKAISNRPILKKMLEDHVAAREQSKLAKEEQKSKQKGAAAEKESTKYLQPGEYCIITERATINEIGQMELAKEFGHNRGRLAGLIKTKNENEKNALTALYHDPNDGQLYFIGKDGTIKNAREVRDNLPPTANSELVKQITTQHLLTEKEKTTNPGRFLKQGEFVTLNEKGEMTSLGHMQGAETFENNNKSISEHLANILATKNEKLTALYHEPNTGEIFFVSHDGKFERAKKFQTQEALPPGIDKEMLEKVVSRHDQAKQLEKQRLARIVSNQRAEEEQSKQFLKPGEYAIFNDKGDLSYLGDNKVTPIGQNVNEIAANLRNKNLRDHTTGTVLFHDPDSKKMFFIDHNGIISDSKKIYKNLVTSEDEKSPKKLEEYNAIKKKLNNTRLIQPGEVYFLDHEGEVREVSELKENGQYGSDLTEMAGNLHDWNEKSPEEITAVYLNPKDHELYYVDEFGVIHNVRDMREGNADTIYNKNALESFRIASHGLQEGECRILDENGQLQEVVRMEPGGNFGRDVAELATILRENNSSQNKKNVAVCKDSATGEIYLVDRDGLIHNTDDAYSIGSPKPLSQRNIQDLVKITQHIAPDEVLVLNAEGEVIESGKLSKNSKLGNNLLELANKIGIRNVQEESKVTAVYKSSGDGDVYMVDENGQVHNISDLKEGRVPNLQNLGIAKKILVENINSLKPGTCIIVDERGQIKVTGPVSKGSQFGETLDQLSDHVRKGNEESDSQSYALFKDPKTQEIYLIDKKGNLHNQKDILQPTLLEGKEFIKAQNASVTARSLKPSGVCILNEKGQVVVHGDMSQKSTYGKSKEELGHYIASQNEKNKTELTAVVSDPKTGEKYYIDKQGVLHNLKDLNETSTLNLERHRGLIAKLKAHRDIKPGTCAVFDQNGKVTEIKAVKNNQELHELAATIQSQNKFKGAGHVTGLFHDPANGQKIYIDADGKLHNSEDLRRNDKKLKGRTQQTILHNITKLQAGQVGIFDETGELIWTEEVGKGEKTGETLGQVARKLKAQNQREVAAQMALYQDPATGQTYFIDDLGAIHNMKDEKLVADSHKLAKVQRILLAADRLLAGRFAITDDAGNVKQVGELAKDHTFGPTLADFARKLHERNLENGTDETGLYLDPATEELYVIDTEGVIHDAQDLKQKLIAANKGNYKLAKKIIAKYLANSKPTKKQARHATSFLGITKGPLLKPGQFYILSNKGQIKDIGDFKLGSEFGGQNAKKLAEAIKLKNSSQKTGNCALYHDPDDGQLYFIDKDGNYVPAEQALQNPKNNFSAKIINRAVDRHKIQDSTDMLAEGRKSRMIRRSQLFAGRELLGDEETLVTTTQETGPNARKNQARNSYGRGTKIHGTYSNSPSRGGSKYSSNSPNIHIPLLKFSSISNIDSDYYDGYSKNGRSKGTKKKRDTRRKFYIKKDSVGNLRELEHYSDEEVDGKAKKERFGIPDGAVDKLNRSTPASPWKMFKDHKFAGTGRYPHSPELRRRYLLEYLQKCEEEDDENDSLGQGERSEEESSTEIANALNNMPVTDTKFLFSRIAAGNILFSGTTKAKGSKRNLRKHRLKITKNKVRNLYSNSPYLEFLPQMMRKEEEHVARLYESPQASGNLYEEVPKVRGADRKLSELASSYSRRPVQSRARTMMSKIPLVHKDAEVTPHRPEAGPNNGNYYDRYKSKSPKPDIVRETSINVDIENRGDNPSQQGSRTSEERENKYWQTNSTKFNFE